MMDLKKAMALAEAAEAAVSALPLRDVYLLAVKAWMSDHKGAGIGRKAIDSLVLEVRRKASPVVGRDDR